MYRNWGCCETRSQFGSSRCKFEGDMASLCSHGITSNLMSKRYGREPSTCAVREPESELISLQQWLDLSNINAQARLSAITLSLQALSYHSRQLIIPHPSKFSRPYWHMMSSRKHLKHLAFKTWISVANYNTRLQICSCSTKLHWVVHNEKKFLLWLWMWPCCAFYGQPSTSWSIKNLEVNGHGGSHQRKLAVGLHTARDAKSIYIQMWYY